MTMLMSHPLDLRSTAHYGWVDYLNVTLHIFFFATAASSVLVLLRVENWWRTDFHWEVMWPFLCAGSLSWFGRGQQGDGFTRVRKRFWTVPGRESCVQDVSHRGDLVLLTQFQPEATEMEEVPEPVTVRRNGLDLLPVAFNTGAGMMKTSAEDAKSATSVKTVGFMLGNGKLSCCRGYGNKHYFHEDCPLQLPLFCSCPVITAKGETWKESNASDKICSSSTDH